MGSTPSIPKTSRLKPVIWDPLGSVGLPSKGDTALLDLEAQEVYFGHVVAAHRHYLQNNTSKGLTDGNNELSRGLEKLSLHPKDLAPTTAVPEKGTEALPPPLAPSKHIILSSMRKLRESLVATHRSDGFALEVYLFIIKFAILERQPESYYPAILSLLWNRQLLIDETERRIKREVVGWLILDLACRQGDMASAWDTLFNYFGGIIGPGDDDNVVSRVLRCLVRDDWYAYWTLKGKLDRYQHALVEFADPKMRQLAIGRLGKAYLKIDVGFVHRATGALWKILN